MGGHNLETGRNAKEEEKYRRIILCRVDGFRENRRNGEGTFVIGYYYYYHYLLYAGYLYLYS